MKKIIENIKYKIKKLDWLLILFSPFKFPKIKIYFGKIQYGLPYFLPRKYSVKKKKYVDKKWFSIDVQTLLWKTKWNEIRHEHSPKISIILFNRQLVFIFGDNSTMDMCRWEAYLYYKYRTKEIILHNLQYKKFSKQMRIAKVLEQYSTTWISKEKETNYYYQILKKKYIKNIK